jgi:hypothetical protein
MPALKKLLLLPDVETQSAHAPSDTLVHGFQYFPTLQSSLGLHGSHPPPLASEAVQYGAGTMHTCVHGAGPRTYL